MPAGKRRAREPRAAGPLARGRREDGLPAGGGVAEAEAQVLAVVALSRRARRVVTANLWFAAVIIAGLASWDLAGPCRCPSASSATRALPSSSA